MPTHPSHDRLRLPAALVAVGFAACADRVAPADAGEAHVYQCVEPGPQPFEDTCGQIRDSTDCRHWAEQYAAGAIAYAACAAAFMSPSHDAGCLQVSSCEDVDGGVRCLCGDEPPCGPGQICVSDAPDATPYCRCTMQ